MNHAQWATGYGWEHSWAPVLLCFPVPLVPLRLCWNRHRSPRSMAQWSCCWSAIVRRVSDIQFTLLLNNNNNNNNTSSLAFRCIFFFRIVLSAMSQIIAFACWVAQFYQYLSNNVLLAADRDMHWYSKDMSKLGHSFYLVVVGILVVIVNIVILVIAYRMEKRERRPVSQEPYDEKMAGAIMLY